MSKITVKRYKGDLLMSACQSTIILSAKEAQELSRALTACATDLETTPDFQESIMGKGIDVYLYE